MTKAQTWIHAMRLRTLPLSMATIITGNFLAFPIKFSWIVFVLCVLTTVCLQILSNLANDLGDHLKGTDNKNRVGPQRAMQSGNLTVSEMKIGIVLNILLALTFGILLLFSAQLSTKEFINFFVFGIASILAAMFYTMGKRAYGYHALGDLFVFIFFGILGVVGSFYLQYGKFLPIVLVPASIIGLLSAAVLNLNNMRDIDNDKASNKNTLAVKLGKDFSKFYHAFLILLSMILILGFISRLYHNFQSILSLFVLPLLALHLMRVMKIRSVKEYDPELKKVALTTFLFSLLFALSLIQ